MKITKSELRDLIKEVAEELGFIGEGLTKAQEKLPEPLKKAILKKQGKSGFVNKLKKEIYDDIAKELM